MPPIFDPVGPNSNDGANFVHQNVIPRTSHEGIQFDRDGNMYFIDELNGGNVYKYTSAASFASVKNGAAGRLLRRQRPEDMQIQTARGVDYLYVTTTTTNETYRLNLKKNTISVFADRLTINLATGAAVGTSLANVDNLAIDQDGNIYIVEDFAGGEGDDIWVAKDLNGDGDLTDPGEGLARWASNGTLGSEFTGLYFDPFNKRRAWVNIQHPDSNNDRTIEITIP
jgi:hypothetical protein